MKLAIVAERLAGGDRTVEAVRAQVDLAAGSGDPPEVVVFATTLGRPLPCRAHVIGSPWELITNADFADCDIALFHWNGHSSLFDATIVLGHGAPVPVAFVHGYCGRLGSFRRDDPGDSQAELLVELDLPVWTTSANDASALCRLGVCRERIQIVPFPIETPRSPVSRRRTGAVDVAVMGDVAPFNWTEVMVEAIAQLPDDLRERMFVRVAGNTAELGGEDAARLVAVAREHGLERHVELVLAEQLEDRWALLERSHVLVDPSGYGWVEVIHAYRMGCRVISASTGPASCLVQPPDARVNPGDVDGWRGALETVARDVLHVAMVDRRAQLRIAARFDGDVLRPTWIQSLAATSGVVGPTPVVAVSVTPVSARLAMETMTNLLPHHLFPPPGGRTTITNTADASARSVIASLATGSHRLLMAQSAPSLQAYARRHGWDVVLSSEEFEPDRPPSWFKIKLIVELLATYDLVMWVDADAIIVDLERDVRKELDHDADIWFASHPQERNPDAQVLNAGVFLARSTPWTHALLDEMWRTEEYVLHNWWRTPLLHLLGYSLEPPYPQLQVTHWNDRIGTLALDWNSVPDYCEGPSPAINHHARGDHDDFERRLEEMASDRRAVVARHPLDFEGHWTNTTAPVKRAPRRDHSFSGLDRVVPPSQEELLDVIQRLDELNEEQRLRLMQMTDWFELAVDAEVARERDADRARTALQNEQRVSDDLRLALAAAERRADAAEEQLHQRTPTPTTSSWLRRPLSSVRLRRG